MQSDNPVFVVKSARGVHLTLEDGRQLIDGMSSWWCAIHGYNVAELNDAIKQQLDDMAHVMFGGLTHAPAVDLCKKLVEITPDNLDTVFLENGNTILAGKTTAKKTKIHQFKEWLSRRHIGCHVRM